MRYLVPFLLLFVLGCASESTKNETVKSEPAETAAPETSAAPKKASAANGVEATMNEKQLDAFFTTFGKRMGHDGLNPEQRKNLIGQITSIPVGKDKAAPIHIDHKGQHLDVMMSVKHAEKDKFMLRLESSDADLAKTIRAEMDAATK